MSDITQDQFDKFIDEIRKNSGEMGKLSKAMSSTDRARKDASQKLQRDLRNSKEEQKRTKLNRQLDDASHKFRLLQGNTEELSHSFQAFARGFVGGALVAQMIKGAETLVRTYKEMAEVGQTFNGGVFSMAKAAADAGLPLNEFAAIVKKNSKVMATFGVKPVMEMAKQVRQNTERFGMYGYTIEGLNDVTTEYLETQRLYGNKNAATNERTTVSAQKLALEIGALAATTGKSREEILKVTQEAMRDSALTSRFIGRDHNQMQAFSDAAQRSIAVLSALPGEAGAMMSKFMAQTVGYGTSLFADGANTFIEAGLGSMIGASDQLSREISQSGSNIEGATWEYIRTFKDQVEQNRDSLRLQMMAGNQNAAQILKMYSEVQNITEEQYKAKEAEIKNTKQLTAFMLSFSNIAKRLMNGLLVGIFGGLDDMDAKMKAIVDSPTFLELENTFKNVGAKIGEFFQNLKPQDVQMFADAVGGAVKLLMTLTTWGGKIVGAFMGVVNAAEKAGGPLAALAAALGMIIGGKMLFKMIGSIGSTFLENMIGKRVGTMRVNAGVVNVGGGGGDWFDGPGGDKKGGKGGPKGPHHGPKGPKGGGKGLLGKAGRVVGRVGEHAGGLGKMGAKGLAKMGGKSLLKKIPLIGLGAGALFAGQRLMSGDALGAGGEALSGLASLVPVVGTAASVAIDAGLMARDVMKQNAVPKVDAGAERAAQASAMAAQEKLMDDTKPTAGTDNEQAELRRMMEEQGKAVMAQNALLREQVELLRRGNQISTTIANGLT